MDENIEGLEMTVASTGGTGGSWKNVAGNDMPVKEDEWFPAVLAGYSPFESQWGKQLRWNFELQGADFTWKNKDDKQGQLRTNLQTSMICSPKSKVYKTYVKLTGKEPKEGEKIDLKSLIGTSVYVMIKINYPYWFFIIWNVVTHYFYVIFLIN